MAETIEGEPLSPGVVKGDLVWFAPDRQPTRTVSTEGADQELRKFRSSVALLLEKLDRDIEQLGREGLTAEAQILQTHVFLLRDRAFQQKVEDLVRRNEIATETAIDRVLGEMAEQLERSESVLLAERAADVRDIIRRLQEHVAEEESALFATLRPMQHPVLAVPELLPSLVLEARRSGLGGFVVERGTPLSHAAILAKSFGIPVLRIDRLTRLKNADRRPVLVDALEGRLFIEPSRQEEETVEARLVTEAERQTRESPARIWANIVDPSQITDELAASVAGVGLYRTEMLFMQARHEFPSERQQLEAYRRLFERDPQMPITFRTLDIGGDKSLPYFSLGPQDNPYLGLRAHRVYRYHPEIFLTQVRALLQAACPAAHLRIMYPMIETPEEFSFVQGLLRRALESLESQGRDYQRHFEQGLMIEVPSAVWNIEQLLAGADFASVGTNDLLQYFFAADRSNANARDSYQPLHPSALRMLRSLVQAAERAGKPLSICGEIASDARFVPLLVGLGFRDLSVDIHAIGRIRGLLFDLDLDSCRLLAQRCLKARTSQEVRDILQAFNPTQPASAQGTRGGFIDPICDMLVDPERTRYVVEDKGQKVYFCSAACRDEYLYRQEHE
jgi:phosphoenolpyruvate-protein phosphotransferase